MKPKSRHTLEDLSKKNPFVVPENYFEQLHTQVMSKIAPQKTKDLPKSRRWNLKQIASWSVAAVVILALCMGTGYKLLPVWNELFSAESGINFASADDQDFFLFLQDDNTKKEFLSSDYYN